MKGSDNSLIKEGYNSSIAEGAKYNNDYEFNRWFIRSRNRAEYAMTYIAIKSVLNSLAYTRCLEVGPGPGTWTRLLFRENPDAQLDLVDISEAMKEQFTLEMRTLPNVQYVVADVMRHDVSQPYDLFFSSRAVEYFDDKPAFFKKLTSLVATGGGGVIVTKNPHHGVRKSKAASHQGQIAMSEMKNFLEENGFFNVRFFAAVRRIPVISRFTSEVAEYLFNKNIARQLDVRKKYRTVESYVVTFKKAA